MIRPYLAALFMILATPAAFGGALQQGPQQVAVPIADLDLQSSAGQAALKSRVALAAGALCRPGWMTKSPDSEFAARYNQQIHRACVGRLTDRALARINPG